MPQKQETLTDSVGMFASHILGIVKRFISLEWSAVPVGPEWDPVPNPKQYLVCQVRLGMMQFVFHMNLGRPGWTTKNPGKPLSN